MSSEVIAFSDTFNISVEISEELSVMTNRSIHVQFLKDRKYLFNVI